MDFPFNSNLEFFLDSFRLDFKLSLHLSIGGPLGMVFKHFQNPFDFKDLVNDFA